MSLPQRPALIIAWMIESLLASLNAFSRSRKTAVTLRLDLEFFVLEISLIRDAIASSVPTPFRKPRRLGWNGLVVLLIR